MHDDNEGYRDGGEEKGRRNFGGRTYEQKMAKRSRLVRAEVIDGMRLGFELLD